MAVRLGDFVGDACCRKDGPAVFRAPGAADITSLAGLWLAIVAGSRGNSLNYARVVSRSDANYRLTRSSPPILPHPMQLFDVPARNWLYALRVASIQVAPLIQM